MAYAAEQATEAAGKKFAGILADDSGTNEFVAVRGLNRATQNAETVADMGVSATAASTATAGGAGVSTAATLVNAADAHTLFLVVQNRGANRVYLGFTDSIVAGDGSATTFCWLDTGDSVTLWYSGNIYGITSSGTSVVTVGRFKRT